MQSQAWPSSQLEQGRSVTLDKLPATSWQGPPLPDPDALSYFSGMGSSGRVQASGGQGSAGASAGGSLLATDLNGDLRAATPRNDTWPALLSSIPMAADSEEDLIRRASSMPSLISKALALDLDTGSGAVPTRRKGRGGRTAAMDPRLDPSIDPKRAKRILANRQSAARSKNKQRGHLDSLEAAQNVLVRQKSILLKEVAWLRAEVQSMEEEGTKLARQIEVLREHAVLQEALQIKLLEECGQSFPDFQ